MYGALLHHPARDDVDVRALRVCASGGAAMPGELLRAFEAQFGCTVLEGYGLSETSPVASFDHPDRERKVGSIGTPIEGVEMAVVDEHDRPLPPGEVGEIVIRGHNVMKGYWQRPVDRKKDLIIRAGYNVYPREVEEVLYEHPAVREAAVVGVRHPELGEEVGAAVALRRARRSARRSCAPT
jgi:long-chain acyl-CoA synthetase